MNKSGILMLKEVGACTESIEWVASVKDIETAWAICPRSDWMIWALRKIGFKDPRKYRLWACACIRGMPLADDRTLWDLLTDERSRVVVEVAERYANGNATEEERADAYASATSATSASTSAYAAAAAAASAAAAAAYVASAADASAAFDSARAWQADLLRQWISWDEVERAIKAYDLSTEAKL